MTRTELLDILKSETLLEVGMRADLARARRHPDGVVTYCAKSEPELNTCVAVLWPRGTSHELLVHTLEKVQEKAPQSVQPIFTADITGTEYLTQVAVCRLYFTDTLNVEVNPALAGTKLAQLALRFGANDLGIIDADLDEERYRALIRDAGFIPRRRDPGYRTLYLQ
jgi:hypothetical protein